MPYGFIHRLVVLPLALMSLLWGHPALAAELSVEEAYIRELPPNQKVSAAFGLINNPSADRYFIRAAQSSVAERVELHEIIESEGMLRMQRMKQFIVPPQGQLKLQPGGQHLMLIGLKQPLKAGDQVLIKLTLGNGEILEMRAQVRSLLELPK